MLWGGSKFLIRWLSATLLIVVLLFLIIRIYHDDPKERVRNIYPSVKSFVPRTEHLVFGSGKPLTEIVADKVSLQDIKLAIVTCKDKLNMTITALKSAAAFTRKAIHFILFADEQNQMPLEQKILQWPKSVLKRVSYEIHPISYPGNVKDWQDLFKPCASQRLFLPTLLPHIDSLLYVDSDVLFLQPIESIWSYFSSMNSSHIAGLTSESEDFATGWYNRFARHPYYPPLGVNSGVMLMNLTRMRRFEWQTYLDPVLKEYKLKIAWGDQDIINIIFHHHTDKLLIFPCKWNYRPDHCMYTSVCKDAATEGIGIVHGSRGVFINDKMLAFKVFYKAMEQFDLDKSLAVHFLDRVKQDLGETKSSNCGKLFLDLLKHLAETINSFDES